MAFDDGDVGVTNVVFNLRAQLCQASAALLQKPCQRHARNTSGRPQEHLRCAMVADDLRLDIDGINTKMGAEMYTKPQTVQKRAGAEHAIVPGELSRDV